MQLVNENNEPVQFGQTVIVMQGMQKGASAEILQVTKGTLLKVKTPKGFRVYDPKIMGLKWETKS